MLSVFKRELRSFFYSWRGYVFIAIFAFCSCAVRMVYNYMSLYDNLYGFINHEYILTFLPVAFALAIPVLTFSMYENERKNGVFSFLRSLPIGDADVFFGKYLAAGALSFIAYVVATAVDIALGFYSTAGILTSVLSVLGLLLIAGVLLAMNMFFALIFKNRFVALGLGYGVAVALTALCATRYLMPMLLTDIVGYVSVFGAYTSVLFGLFDISSVVLWLSLGGLFILISWIVVKKKAKALIAIASAAVIVLNVALGFIPDRYRRIDLTAADSYTLSDTTVKYFGELDEKITLNVIGADGSDLKYEYLLRRIDDSSKNIDVKWLSIDGAKSFTDSLGVTEAVNPYFIVAESDRRNTFVPYSELISYRTDNASLKSFLGASEMSLSEYEYWKAAIVQYAQSNTEYAESYYEMLELLLYETKMYFSGEPYLCGVVEYLTVETIPARYVLTGHGESPFSRTEMGYYILEEMGLTHKELDTAAALSIPEDAVSILVIHPKSDISEGEAELFLNYLNSGGQMTFFTTEENLGMPNLMSVMREYGMWAESGIVSEIAEVEIKNDTESEEDAEESTEKQYETVYRNNVSVHVNTEHKATNELKSMISNMTPVITCGNDIKYSNSVATLSVTPILTTSESAYIGNASDSLAPRTLAAVSDKQGGGTLLWFTGAESFTEPILDKNVETDKKATVYSNISLVLSSFGLAPFTYESVVELPDAKYHEARLMSVTETNFVLHSLVTIIIAFILAVVGVILCYKRRRA